MVIFVKDFYLLVICVDVIEQFFSKLKGVVDLERKRKIIGVEFIVVFDEFLYRLEREIGKMFVFFVQGIFYLDVIELCFFLGSGKLYFYIIKSYYNVGGLFENMKLKLVEFFKWFFKDEV